MESEYITGLGLALSREILDITGIAIRETGEPGRAMDPAISPIYSTFPLRSVLVALEGENSNEVRFWIRIPKGMCHQTDNGV